MVKRGIVYRNWNNSSKDRKSRKLVLLGAVRLLEWIATREKLKHIVKIYSADFFGSFSIQIEMRFHEEDTKYHFVVVKNYYHEEINYLKYAPGTLNYQSFSDFVRFMGWRFN